MNPRRYTHQTRHRCTSFRLGLAIVFSAAILMAQALPAVAGLMPNGSGIWVEICSDGETYLAEIGSESEKSHECSHCQLCLAWSSDLQLFAVPEAGRTQRDYATAIHSFDLARLNAGPEQYWSLCRGPPILSVEKQMTPLVSLYVRGTDLDDLEIMSAS